MVGILQSIFIVSFIESENKYKLAAMVWAITMMDGDSLQNNNLIIASASGNGDGDTMPLTLLYVD
jgi:hypothetical protein